MSIHRGCDVFDPDEAGPSPANAHTLAASMKRRIAVVAASIAAINSLSAEIVINEFLSVKGFIDSAYTHASSELGGQSESDHRLDIDQAEVSLHIDYQELSAKIDFQYISEDIIEENEDEIVEQAYLSYEFRDGHSLTTGRYASMIGFEAFEPTGLYQYSTAYQSHALGFQNRLAYDVSLIPGYANGAKYVYQGYDSFFGISVQDEVFGSDSGGIGNRDEDGGAFGFEIAYSRSLYYGLTWFIGGAFEEGEAGQGDSYMLNAYATFDFGAWFFAGELSRGNSESGAFALGGTDEEALQMLLMANYTYSEKASITARVSYADHEDDPSGDALDFTKFTLAHGYAFTGNLFLVNEISLVDGESNGTNFENLLGAVELIFSF